MLAVASRPRRKRWTAPQPSASPGASSIRDSYFFVSIFAVLVLIGVEGALITLIVKYRREEAGPLCRRAAAPTARPASKILWTVVPVLILATIAETSSSSSCPTSQTPRPRAPPNETLIKVEGRQFYWMFHYPNGAISVGTMTAPAGDVVHEDVFAPPTDVLHSWWVPKLGGKIDAVPGRINHTWFEAPAGSIPARCSDLCRIQHPVMLATVKVVPRSEYEAFVEARAADPTGTGLGARSGRMSARPNTPSSTRTSWGRRSARTPLLSNAKDLSTILRRGVESHMPAVGSDWTDAQIDALVAYTSTLVKGQGPNGG